MSVLMTIHSRSDPHKSPDIQEYHVKIRSTEASMLLFESDGKKEMIRAYIAMIRAVKLSKTARIIQTRDHHQKQMR